jgi:hypothetical protein
MGLVPMAAVRLRWLSDNPLPRSVRYYTIVSFAARSRRDS